MSIVPQDIINQLEELYASLPTMQCKGKCQTCCGPIDMSLAEQVRIEERGVQIPPMTPDRVSAWEANHKFHPVTGDPLWCPALDLETGGCKVYDVRPIVCRLWGTSESMPCGHGCETTKMLTNAEALDFIVKSMKIGGGSRNGMKVTDDEERLMQAIMQDHTAGPLMGRFLEGDRSVEPDVIAQIERIKKEIGL